MLDSKELAERLRAAMDYREPPLGSSELARRCKVTKQAVYEWRTTGRMGKSHLVGVATETGMPLEYFLEPVRGSSSVTRMIWRRLGKAFAKVATLAVLALPPFLPTRVEAAFNITQYTLSFRRFIALFTTWRNVKET
jgi:hypothetical protein